MEEIDLKDMLLFFWNKKIVVIVVVLLVTILVGVYTKIFLKPVYKASTSLILIETEFKNKADFESYSKSVDRYCVIANSRKIKEKVIKNLKLNIKDFEKFEETIEILGFPYSYLIEINVSNINSDDAVKIANEIAKTVMEEINSIYGDDKIQVLDFAKSDDISINDNLIENMVKSLIVTAILVFGYYFVNYMFFYKKEENKK